jgi:hypothetical protein
MTVATPATPKRAQNAGRFPWGSNQPTTTERIVVALVLASVAAALNYFRAAEKGGISDFTPLWYGAKMLLHGRNPYLLIGPHRLIDTPTPLVYPAPAFVSVIPLTVFSFHAAGAAFVFLSTALLAWGITTDGWHRLPIFPSVAFLTSAQLGQWSILMTSALFIPLVAIVAVAKPQASLPIVGSTSSKRTVVAAVIGGVVLVALSFALVPEWPHEWLKLIGSTDYFTPPILRMGGALVAIVLLRWRRREAWLVFIAACLPQTWYPYNGLLLLAVAATYREACVLSLFSSAAWMAVFLFIPGEMRSEQTRATWSAVMLATSYLPAVIIVLRRPNKGPSPWFLSVKAAAVTATTPSTLAKR